MAYKYDVFLSYNRKFPHGDWVNDLFYPLFKSYLDDALNKDVQIFKDSQEIQTGNDFNLKIRNALVHSKIMVSIFSPSYFRSEWCMREFSTIFHRQKSLGFLTLENPAGLIIPLRLFDGEHYPDYARSLQMLDCIDFNMVGPCVKQAQIYLDLQKKLQVWVYEVAKAVNSAPNFDSNWLKEEWVENPYENNSIMTLPININAPYL